MLKLERIVGIIGLLLPENGPGEFRILIMVFNK
jgi:hypothetical protein